MAITPDSTHSLHAKLNAHLPWHFAYYPWLALLIIAPALAKPLGQFLNLLLQQKADLAQLGERQTEDNTSVIRNLEVLCSIHRIRIYFFVNSLQSAYINSWVRL